MNATAPYNFVPFVQPFTADELNGTGFRLPPHDVYVPGLNSGFIDYTLTTLTPLFIGAGPGGGRSLTFTPEGGSAPSHFWIPGSEIHGMLRFVLEAVLGGGLEDPTVKQGHDAPQFFRAPFAASQDYRDAYWAARAPRPADQRQEAAGLLYRIREGEAFVYRLVPTEARKTARGRLPGGAPHDAEAAARSQFRRVRYVADPIDRERVRVVSGDGRPDAAYGYLLVPGVMSENPSKPAYVFAEAPLGPRALEVDTAAVVNYTAGRTAHTNAHVPQLHEYWSDHPQDPVPVFYDTDRLATTITTKSGKPVPMKPPKVLRIGTAPAFRVRAAHTLTSTVDESARLKPATTGAVEALLGRVVASEGEPGSDIAGRVSVGHALAPFDPNAVLAPQPVRLESPKPTATHLTLLPTGEPGQRQLATFGDDARYRGRKVYLHRWNLHGTDDANWAAAAGEHRAGAPRDASEGGDPVEPLRSGLTFRGRIRFHNLTDAELGALIFAIELRFTPGAGAEAVPTRAHKIGGLKPLGLGSVHLTAKVTTLDPRLRYTSASGVHDVTEAEEQRFWKVFVLPQIQRLRDKPKDQQTVLRSAWNGLERATRWSGRLDRAMTAQMSTADNRQRPLLPTLAELFLDG